MEFYQHQKNILQENKQKCGLFLGTGSGKTRVAAALAEGVTLVICPKQQAVDKTWEKEWEAQHKNSLLYVLSKEQFKKCITVAGSFFVNGCKYPDTIIVDEAHTVAGVTPFTRQKHYQKYPKTSQIYDAVHRYINTSNPKRVYLLTATPVPQPMAVWGLGRLLGKKWDFYKWRDQFYFEQSMRGRIIYMPNRSATNKILMDKLVRSIGYVGGISDFVDVPDQVYKEHNVGMTGEQSKKLHELKMLYPDPLVQVGKRHQLEQGIFEGEHINEQKAEAIEQYFNEFKKVIVFCKYTAQIEYYQKHFAKVTRVFVLNGKTPNEERKNMMKTVGGVAHCVVLVQSSVSAGWECPGIMCMIFASNSYSYVDRIQAEGRIQRINHVKKNIYIDLVAGEIDEKVLKCIKSKVDFSEYTYAKKGS